MRGLDEVICEFPLPTEEVEERMINPPDWAEFEFQTESFNNNTFWLDSYTIEEDGTIYKKNVNRKIKQDADHDLVEIEEVDEGIERIDFTGELVLFGLHLEKDFDFTFEIKMLYYKGESKEAELLEWHKTDNSARKETQEKIGALQEKFEHRKKKWWYKFGIVFNSLIGLFFGLGRYLLGWAVKISWSIENFIRFKN